MAYKNSLHASAKGVLFKSSEDDSSSDDSSSDDSSYAILSFNSNVFTFWFYLLLFFWNIE